MIQRFMKSTMTSAEKKKEKKKKEIYHRCFQQHRSHLQLTSVIEIARRPFSKPQNTANVLESISQIRMIDL
jgi:hypothetical protein